MLSAREKERWVTGLKPVLDEWGLTDDTILIFMTDNGSSGGCTLESEIRIRSSLKS